MTVQSKWYDDFVNNLPNLEGKIIAITGCTSGIGLVAAKTCALKGASVILMLNRPSERARNAQAIVEKLVASNASSMTTIIETIPCDLQNFESVRKAAQIIKEKYTEIDVLCNNAGVMGLEDVATVDGYDKQIQTNHLSHFLLTKELMPLLRQAAKVRGESRVVNHSSLMRRGQKLKSKYFGKNNEGKLGGNGSFLFTGGKWKRYHQSKLANVVFTQGLKDYLDNHVEENVITTVAAPGVSATNMESNAKQNGGGADGMSMMMMKMAQSAEDGTMPLLSAMFLPSENGDFWEPTHLNRFRGPAGKYALEKECLDKASRKMLWAASEAACGEFDQ